MNFGHEKTRGCLVRWRVRLVKLASKIVVAPELCCVDAEEVSRPPPVALAYNLVLADVECAILACYVVVQLTGPIRSSMFTLNMKLASLTAQDLNKPKRKTHCALIPKKCR